MAKRRTLALLAAAFVVALDTQPAKAHPGHHRFRRSYENHAQRHFLAAHTKRSLTACQLAPRKTPQGASHPKTLFGSDPRCILEPEVTLGPYYVSGELLRTDIRESQAGIDLYTELQIIDVNTCKPVENLFIGFWHCNTTGVYAGVIASGNGDSTDLTNVDKTFNRGLAPTDTDGVVSFLTTFPGHYAGRAVHIHVLGTHNGTLLPNNTYGSGVASHVGQIFFDQDLVSSVQATQSYAANKQELTTNVKDGIFAQAASSGFDPVVEYVLLGDSVEKGVFSWISIGVNMTTSNAVTGAAAAKWTAGGGVTTSNNGIGPGRGGGKGPGNGPPPPMGSGDSSDSADTESTSSPSFAGRNLAIAFLLFLGFLVSPYNRWIPVPCRLGVSDGSGGDAPSSSQKYAQINHS